MTKPRWLNEQEACMWRSFRLMWMRLDQAVEQQLSTESGLSGADYALLVPLSEATEDGLRARDLARGVSWDRSRLSHQLRRMQERGLVERRECPTDARGTIFALTPAGREVIERAAPSHVETVREVFVDVMTPDEIATLSAISQRVLSRLDAKTLAPHVVGS
ncbi:MarR family transcriptional regulator [Jatrophihabitans sp. GAS493]|uniref:MarR family winged helix-turn-helix transcriptional regulator n=1 Tax=Jatrophihabitans sp. GAS493 TaxID=1907575 RepID=UPI000BB96BB8|nr:MarR family transcriptional regulator [Jatrophihabitans sp. GAS493]SOD71509.1 MarR family transcriptional regulator [Jatrophihabitans sp. GAS493]